MAQPSSFLKGSIGIHDPVLLRNYPCSKKKKVENWERIPGNNFSRRGG